MTLAVLALVLAGTSPQMAGHFDVTGRFVPRKGTDGGDVAVTFVARNPDVHINENPAPRLKLDPEQKVLADKPRKGTPPPPPRPGEARYLDLTFPVLFPVTLAAPTAPATVKATVTYFYCSQREGWCRKGTDDLELPIGGR